MVKLQGYPYNARVHPPGQIDALKAAITDFGQVDPLIVQRGTMRVLGGNGRLQALREMNTKDALCVIVDIDDDRARLLNISLNRIGEMSSWDNVALRESLKTLEDIDFDITALGYSSDELDALVGDLPDVKNTTLEDDTEITQDEIPDVPKKAVARLGDIWFLGEHRLYCGDSTIAECVNIAMRDFTPEMMITDIPYGVEYAGAWDENGKRTKTGKGKGLIANDDNADWRKVYLAFPGSIAYVWHADKFTDVLMAGLRESGFIPRNLIVWAKSRQTLNRAGHYHGKVEFCWYAIRKGKTAEWAGDAKQTTLWEADTPSGEDRPDHPTPKPVELMARPMFNHACRTIFDPFVGSGSTLIAAEQMNRRLTAIELDPKYVDVTIERWQRLTGAKAQRVTKGK